MEYQFLNALLTTFRNAAEIGMANLMAPALGLATVLGILDITAMWGLYFGELRIKEIIGKAIKIGFFVFLIMNWSTGTKAVEATFIKVANIAASGETGKTPQDIMKMGTKKMYRLWNNAIYDIPMSGVKEDSSGKAISFYDEQGNLKENHEELLKQSKEDSNSINPFSGLGEAMAAIPGRLIKILLCLVIFIAFAFIALNVLLCNVEFLIVTTLSIILLPFGINNHTSFISQKALGAVVNFGVKLMVMFFLLGLTMKGIEGMSTIANDDYGKLFEAVLEAVMYAFLIWKMPGLISGMLSGTPSMGASAGGVAGAVGGAARAGAATAKTGAILAATGGRAVLSGAGRAASVAGRAATGAARGAVNAGRIGRDALRSGSPGRHLATVAGAKANSMKQVAKHRIDATKSSVLNTSKQLKNAVSNTANQLKGQVTRPSQTTRASNIASGVIRGNAGGGSNPYKRSGK